MLHFHPGDHLWGMLSAGQWAPAAQVGSSRCGYASLTAYYPKDSQAQPTPPEPLHLLNLSLLGDPGDCHGRPGTWCCSFHGLHTEFCLQPFLLMLYCEWSLLVRLLWLCLWPLWQAEKRLQTPREEISNLLGPLWIFTPLKRLRTHKWERGNPSKPNTLKREKQLQFWRAARKLRWWP